MSFRCIYYTMNLNGAGEHKNQPMNPLDSLVEIVNPKDSRRGKAEHA